VREVHETVAAEGVDAALEILRNLALGHQQMVLDLGVGARGVTHAEHLGIEGEFPRGISVEGGDVADPRRARFACDTVTLLGEIDEDPFWIAQPILSIAVFRWPTLDADRRIEILQVALDLQDVVDLETEVVQAGLLGTFTGRSPALEERNRGVTIGDVDASLAGAIVLLKPEPTVVPIPHSDRILAHDREVVELRHLYPPFARVARNLQPLRPRRRSTSVRAIVRDRSA
jgi:hypothetical protein